MPISTIYSKIILIPKSAIDENGHVNNVAYVQWMQDIAVEHYASIGGIEAQGNESTWVVREHKVEYLLPAFVNEEIEIKTWVKIFGVYVRYENMNLSESQMRKF